jgi:hypothetical protein
MDTTTNQEPFIRRTLLFVLTFVLWLLTIALGFLVLSAVQDTVDKLLIGYIFNEIDNQRLGSARGGGMRSIVNYATISICVLVWIIGIVIAGMEYHFKRIGQRNSYRVFAWTIGIEVAILIICQWVLTL